MTVYVPLISGSASFSASIPDENEGAVAGLNDKGQADVAIIKLPVGNVPARISPEASRTCRTSLVH